MTLSVYKLPYGVSTMLYDFPVRLRKCKVHCYSAATSIVILSFRKLNFVIVTVGLPVLFFLGKGILSSKNDLCVLYSYLVCK